MTMQCPICVFEVREKECLSDGLYCLIPPKDSIGKQYNVTDAGILYENLYGRCLHETIKEEQPDLLGFFNYLYNVRNTCFTHKSFFGIDTPDLTTLEDIIECAENQVSSVGGNVWQVEQCVANSFKEPGNNSTDNMLLYQDKLLAEVYGISIHPAITINGQIYKGDLDGQDIFRAICAGFS